MIADLVHEFTSAYENRHLLARQWKAEGRKIFGYLYSFIPEEVLYAAGVTPVQLTESGERNAYVAGRHYFAEFYCDFACSCLGQGVLGLYDYLDGVIMPDACETIRGVAGLWELHVPTGIFHYMPMCSQADDASKSFYAHELTRLRQHAERSTGLKVSTSSLHRAIEIYNENRYLLRQISEFRRGEQPRLSGREFFEVARAGLVIPKERHNQMMQRLLGKLPYSEGCSGSGPRVFVSSVVFEECLQPQSDIIGMIEELGGNVVGDDLCEGPRLWWEPVKLEGNLEAAIVARYLASPPIPFRRPCHVRAQELISQALNLQIQGVIFLIPKYCTTYLWEYPYIASQLKDHGIPVMLIETTQMMSALPTRARLEAFLEMLREI